MKLFLKILKGGFFFLLSVYILLWILPFLLPVYPDDYEAVPFENSQQYTVREVRLHSRYWQSKGDSSLGKILFVHGFSGSTFSWRKNIESFVDAGYDILAIDLSPFGYSERNEAINHSSSARALRAWALIDTYKLEGNWTLIGHSMGGSVIGAMAALKPDRVNHLVYVDGFSSDGIIQDMPFKYKLLKRLLPWERLGEVAGYYMMYTPEKIEELLSGAYGVKPDEEAVSGYLAPLKQAKTASGIIQMAFNSKEESAYEVNDFKGKSLIIWGEKDQWVSAKVGEKLEKRLTNAELVYIKDAGHCPMETHPEAFNTLVLNFLKDAN